MTEQDPNQDYGRLIVQGEDRPGIVANVSAVLTEHGANIVSLDQYSSDPAGGRFFQRTVFHLPELSAHLDELSESLETKLGAELGLEFQLVEVKRRKRVAAFDSGPRIMACLRNLTITIHRLAGATNQKHSATTPGTPQARHPPAHQLKHDFAEAWVDSGPSRPVQPWRGVRW